MIRGFFWGAVIGAILGLLFAPRRGEETRAQLQARLNELQGQAQVQYGAIKTKSSDIIEQGRQTVNSTLGRAQSAADDAAAQAQNHINENR